MLASCPKFLSSQDKLTRRTKSKSGQRKRSIAKNWPGRKVTTTWLYFTTERHKEQSVSLSQEVSPPTTSHPNNSYQVNKFRTNHAVPISSSYSPTGIRRDRGWDANSNGSYLSLEDFSPFQRFLHVCQWTRRKTLEMFHVLMFPCSMFQYSIC